MIENNKNLDDNVLEERIDKKSILELKESKIENNISKSFVSEDDAEAGNEKECESYHSEDSESFINEQIFLSVIDENSTLSNESINISSGCCDSEGDGNRIKDLSECSYGKVVKGNSEISSEISSTDTEIDDISIETPFLKRTIDDDKIFNEINKLRKISKICTFIDFISGFAYLSLKYQFFWLLLTSIPSIYIFYIIPRSLIYYKNPHQKKLAIDSFKKAILQNKHIEYYKKWLMIISFIRLIMSIFIWIQLETDAYVSFILIFLILFPLITSFIVSSFEMKFVSKIRRSIELI